METFLFDDGGSRRGFASGSALTFMMAIGVAAVLFVSGCAGRRPPVSKIVKGRVVVTRAISPEAYEHATRSALFAEEERWEEAAAELQRALTFDGQAAELRAGLAECLLRLDRLEDAAAQADESLKMAQSVEGYLAAARVAEARRDLTGAIGRYQAAASLARGDEDPENTEMSHLALAAAQMGALDVTGAHQTAANLRDLNSDSVQARVQLAALGWALGRLPEAEAALGEALVIEPADAEARLLLGALYAATGRPDRAKEAFREAINRTDELLSITEMFLKWLVSRGDLAEAGREADRLTPDAIDDATIETIVRIERASGRPERAMAAIDTARKRGASAVRLSALAAGVLADRKEFQAAAKMLVGIPKEAAEAIDARLQAAQVLRELATPAALREADLVLNEVEVLIAARATPAAKTGSGATVSPTSPPAKPGQAPLPRVEPKVPKQTAAEPNADRLLRLELAVARALLAEKRGDAIRAAKLLDAALGSDPEDARLLLVRASIEERRGEWKRALGFAERVLANDSRNVEALNFHGFVCAEHSHDLAVTIRRLQIAVALNPGAGGIMDSLGWAYFQSGQLALAAARLGEADRLEPGDPEIMSHLGDLYAKQSDVERAVSTYREALSHDPSDKLKLRIQTRLRELGARQAAGR